MNKNMTVVLVLTGLDSFVKNNPGENPGLY